MMADIVRDLLGTVQDLRKTLDKKLKEWNVEHAWVKQAITGLNSEANALKAEVTGITAAAKWGSAEVTGASAGFKLFNAEKTLFDLQEMRDKARGVDPDSLKASITAVERRVAATRTSLARTILRARTEITATRTIAEKAERDSRQALRRGMDALRKAEAAHRRQRTAASNARGPMPPGRVSNVQDINEASRAINELERRLSGLVRALG
ncbi:hypothetical protein [Streptomyces iranensis]|uniref:hypothetical protein n=1 Tax=Streptomyces iranensis TaxID=576784 RepID=UPI0039B76BCD